METPCTPCSKVFKDLHDNCIFEDNGVRRGNFVIAPDWVSEDQLPAPAFQGRKYRPWPYEFKGARFWPETPPSPAEGGSGVLQSARARIHGQPVPDHTPLLYSDPSRPATALVLSDGFLQTGVKYRAPFGRTERRKPALSAYAYNPEQTCAEQPPAAHAHTQEETEALRNDRAYAYYYDHLDPCDEDHDAVARRLAKLDPPVEKASDVTGYLLPPIRGQSSVRYMNFANGYHFPDFLVTEPAK